MREIPETIKILDYTGPVDYRVIDRLAVELREKAAGENLNMLISKRIYAVVVECLENIIRYADAEPVPNNRHLPYLTVLRVPGRITVRTGNLVTEQKASDIRKRLDLLNSLSYRALNDLFEQEISRETNPGETGARLGFIMMKMKSGNKISYDIDIVENGRIYFKLEISINE